MARSVETVRTDRKACLLDEAIPSWRKPQHCGLHMVSWWTDEPSLKEIVKGPVCPCCSGEMPLADLMAIESTRIERALAAVREVVE